MTSMIDVAVVGSANGLRLTPYEAMVQDLLFIRAELEMAGIPFLLIRGADGRPALVVDIGLRARVAEALMAACLEAPLRGVHGTPGRCRPPRRTPCRCRT